MAANGNTSAKAAIEGAGTTPPDTTTKASMGALTAAGVDLARFTMWMIVVAIVVLIAMLWTAEADQGQISDRVIAQQLSMIAANPDQTADPRLASVAAALRRAAADPASTLSPAEATDTRALIDQALARSAITPAQRAALDGRCLPLPSAAAPERAATLQGCATTLAILMGDSEILGQRIAFMQSVQKGLSDDRAAHRAFWLQAAQLVLINLLLPILTALLGYIFGTQQAQP